MTLIPLWQIWMALGVGLAIAGIVSLVYSVVLRRDARRLQQKLDRTAVEPAQARIGNTTIETDAMEQIKQRYVRFSSILAFLGFAPLLLSMSAFYTGAKSRTNHERIELIRDIDAVRSRVIKDLFRRNDYDHQFLAYSPVLRPPLFQAPAAADVAKLRELSEELRARSDDSATAKQERTTLQVADATSLCANGRFDDVLETLRDAPDRVSIRQLRALAFWAKNEWPETLGEHAANRSIFDNGSAVQIAGCHLHMLQLEDAESCFRQLTNQPLRGSVSAAAAGAAAEGRGLINLVRGNWSAAVADLDAALEILEADQDSVPPQHWAILYGNRACGLHGLGHSEAAIRDLDEAAQQLATVDDSVDVRPQMAATLANRAYLLSSNGALRDALQAVEKAVDLSTAVAQEMPQRKLAMAETLALRGSIFAAMDKLDAAAQDFEAALAICQDSGDADMSWQAELIATNCRVWQAQAVARIGDHAAAFRQFQTAISEYNRLIERENLAEIQRHLAAARNSYGEALWQSGRSSQAIREFDEVVESYSALAQRTEESFRLELAAALDRRGEMKRDLAVSQALEDHFRAITILRSLTVKSPDADLNAQLASSLNHEGLAHVVAHDPRSAIDSHNEAVDILNQIPSQQATVAMELDLAEAFQNRASALVSLGRRDRAVEDLAQSIQIRERLWKAGSNAAGIGLADALRQRAAIGQSVGNHERVHADLDRAVEIISQLVDQFGEPRYGVTLASHLVLRGERRQQDQRFEEAIVDLERAVDLNRKAHDAGDDSNQRLFASSLNQLARTYATCPDESLQDGIRGQQLAWEACQLTNWGDAQSLVTLAAAYRQMGEIDDAVRWQSKAVENASEIERGGMRATLKELRSLQTPSKILGP